MTAHTPGPWRVGDAGGTVFGPKTANPWPETIAYLTHGEPSARQRANARLIAAAPELRAALKWIINGYERGEDINGPWVAHGIAEARAALAKAKGDT